MGKKTVAVKNKDKGAEIKMYCVSASVSKKGARDLYYDDEKQNARQYSQPQPLEQAVSVMKQWETQSQYYRDVKLHEIGPGKKVKITTEIVEE